MLIGVVVYETVQRLTFDVYFGFDLYRNNIFFILYEKINFLRRVFFAEIINSETIVAFQLLKHIILRKRAFKFLEDVVIYKN